LEESESRCANSVELMDSRLAVLGTKCGPILFQLPLNFRVSAERLERFITLLSAESRYVFEFRHESWYDVPSPRRIAFPVAGEALDGRIRLRARRRRWPNSWLRLGDFNARRGDMVEFCAAKREAANAHRRGFAPARNCLKKKTAPPHMRDRHLLRSATSIKRGQVQPEGNSSLPYRLLSR
jgi:hypothetical protein